MAFRITADFNEQSINNVFGQWTQHIENVILSLLKYVGETFVQNARNNGNYKDQTGNLRSSIGYIVARHGEIISENFRRAGNIQTTARSGKTKLRKAKTDDGVTKAREYAQSIVDEYPHGFVLVCVAGMEYAAAVEAKGFDVITNSSVVAKNDLISAIAALKAKLG